MKILYDHQTFSLQNYGGISRYHAELTNGLNGLVNTKTYLSVLFSNNVHLKECGINVIPFFPDRSIKGKGKFIYYSNQLYSITNLYRKSFDIFHATYYDPYFIPYLKGKPFVITFHDMIYEKFNSEYVDLAADTHIIDNKKRLAEKASHIIAVSESTKKDAVKLLDIDPAKVTVIYHGCSLPIQNETITNIFQPYILYVGNRHMYKNFLGLLNAIYPLLKKYQIKLLCIGGGAFTSVENDYIHSLNISEAVEQQSFNDKSLVQFYQNALAFVFPSLYEGFGIPILEAFACRCPCIVSNISSLPEIAGDAALYIDPTSSASIAHTIELLLNDLNLRTTLIQKGIERLSHFSWYQTILKTSNLYQGLL